MPQNRFWGAPSFPYGAPSFPERGHILHFLKYFLYFLDLVLRFWEDFGGAVRVGIFLCRMNLKLWRNFVWGWSYDGFGGRTHFLSTTNDFERKS